VKPRCHWPVAVAVLLATAGAARADWKERTWAKGKCSVLMPAAPMEQQSGRGEIVSHLWIAVDGTTFYVVGFTTWPGFARADKARQRKALAGNRDSTASGKKGKVIFDKELMLGDHMGREVQVETPEGAVYRVRMYLVGDRLYQVLVQGARAAALGKEADRYLDSFKLVK
jgi:hypothetical protein